MELLEKVWEAVKRFFKVDAAVKFGALVLAIVMWLYVVISNNYVYQVDLPLRIVNVPNEMTIANETPPVVKARFRGTGITYLKTMITRSYSDMSLRLDARMAEESHEFRLPEYIDAHPDNIILPRGLNLELVSVVQPEIIRLELDELGFKHLPIIPDIQVETSPGYTLVGEIRIIPDSLELQGPAGKLAGIDAVRTKEVLIQEADGFVEGTASVHIPNPVLFQSSVRQVKFYADVQTISERRITDIPVEVRNVPSRLTANTAPSTISLTVEGGSQYIYNLEPSDIEVYIDYSRQWNPKQNYYVPVINTPPDVLQWRNANPQRVEIIIVRK